MKQKWGPKIIEPSFEVIPEKEYEQVLEEWSKIVYSYLCQFQKVQSVSSIEVNTLKRTGTDD